jgi:hypothetical protein
MTTPEPPKTQEFSQLTEQDVAVFRKLLPNKNQIETDEQVMAKQNTDWTKMYMGQSKLMLKPQTTQ